MKHLLSALIALSLAGAPAQAQQRQRHSTEDVVGAVLFSLLALGVVSQIAKDGKSRRARPAQRRSDHDGDRPDHTARPTLHKVVPEQCLRQVGGYHVFPARCLTRHMPAHRAQHLPDQCAGRVWMRDRYRQVYGKHCLRANGWRVTG